MFALRQKFSHHHFFVFATLFASEPLEIFRITKNVNFENFHWSWSSCSLKQMNQRRIAVKESFFVAWQEIVRLQIFSKATLKLVTQEKSLVGVRKRNGFLLRDLFPKHNKVMAWWRGPCRAAMLGERFRHSKFVSPFSCLHPHSAIKFVKSFFW